jgi:hypothetical protein
MPQMHVPESRLAREAEHLVRTSSSQFLANHCYRSYAWAVALGERDDISYDAELLYVAALLHDLGLTAEFDTGRCFEVDSAAAGRDLAARGGWSKERCEALVEPIRLHVALVEELGDGPETYLLWLSTGLDVVGHRNRDLDPRTVESVIATYPRLDFDRSFTELRVDQGRRKPGCWAAKAIEIGIAPRIETFPFSVGEVG